MSALLDRLLGRKTKQRVEQKSAGALTADPLRDTIIRETEGDVPRFQDLVNNSPTVETDEIAGGVWNTFGEAVRDVARGAFSYEEPHVRPRDEMLPSHLFNREVVNQVLAHPEFHASRMYTSGNAAESLFSAIALGDVLQESAQECSEHIQRAEEAEINETDLRTVQQQLEDARAKAKEQHDQTGQVTPEAAEEVKKNVKMREVIKENLGKLAQQHAASNAPVLAHQIAEKAAKQVNEQARIMHTMFGLAPGSEDTLNPERRIKLAEKWSENKRLRRTLEMAGRLMRDMRFKRQAKTKHVNVEPVGITNGRDIGRMVPHELARAYIGALRPLWIKDYSERALLEYQMSGKERVGKGALIVVKDGSGSMDMDDRIEWASAVQLACLSIAVREKRAFAGVEFGGQNQARSWTFPKGKPANPEHVLAMASHFYRSSGTSITDGLIRAKQILDSGEPYTTADIILLTDGQCAFAEKDRQIVNELRAKGVRIHGISILAPDNKYLKLACDWQVDIADLAGGNEATDRLATEIT